MLGRALPLSGPAGAPPLGRGACEKPAGSGEKPCSGGSRRKARHKASGHTAVRQPQQPHTSIPEKLLDCTSGLVEDTEEEPAASKMQRPMEMPEAMVRLRPGPRQAFSPHLSSAGPGSPAAETKTEETTLGHGRASKPEDCLNKSTPFHGSPAPGLQSSYLKEQRVPLVTPEKALLQHTRPQKALHPLYSQQPCEAKAPGKGKSPHSAGQGPDLYPGAEGSGCEEQGPHRCPSLRGLKTSHYCPAEQHYWCCSGSHSSFGARCVTLARRLASLNLGLFLCWGLTSQRCSDGSKMRLKERTLHHWQRADQTYKLSCHLGGRGNAVPRKVCLLDDISCFVILLPQMEQLSPQHLAQAHCLGSRLASGEILQVPQGEDFAWRSVPRLSPGLRPWESSFSSPG